MIQSGGRQGDIISLKFFQRTLEDLFDELNGNGNTIRKQNSEHNMTTRIKLS